MGFDGLFRGIVFPYGIMGFKAVYFGRPDGLEGKNTHF
jgi:hypothetical protein